MNRERGLSAGGRRVGVSKGAGVTGGAAGVLNTLGAREFSVGANVTGGGLGGLVLTGAGVTGGGLEALTGAGVTSVCGGGLEAKNGEGVTGAGVNSCGEAGAGVGDRAPNSGKGVVEKEDGVGDRAGGGVGLGVLNGENVAEAGLFGTAGVGGGNVGIGGNLAGALVGNEENC